MSEEELFAIFAPLNRNNVVRIFLFDILVRFGTLSLIDTSCLIRSYGFSAFTNFTSFIIISQFYLKAVWRAVPYLSLVIFSGKLALRKVFSTSFKYILSPIQSRQYSNMVVEHNVKGYEEFTKLVESLESSGQPIHVLFSGGKEANGQSWCPYCVKGECTWFAYLYCIFTILNMCLAEPVIKENLKHASEESHFVHVDVGERA